MKLELAQVRHVARLARLALTPDEEARFTAQLSAILDAVEQLAEVDTTGVTPTTFAQPNPVHARPDAVHGELPVAQALANAPQPVEGCFALPRVLE